MSDTDNQSTANEVPDENQKLKDLEATVMKLQAKNDSLRTSRKEPDGAHQFVKNFTQGNTQGISQAISTQLKPTSGPKVKSLKQPEAIEVDPQLPQCYHNLQQQKTDNMGPPI